MVTRRNLALAIALFALVLVGALVWMADPTGARSGSRSEARDRDLERRTADAPGKGGAGGRAAADAERIAALIERYGSFGAMGRLLLTRPAGPASGMQVSMSGELDGVAIEMEATSDGEGRFAFPPLPRAGYDLLIDSERTRPFAETFDLSTATGEHDFGDIELARWYFVKGRVTGEGGKSLGGATIALIQPGGGEQGFSFLAAAKSEGSEDLALAEATSAEDGSYRLRLADPGIFTVRARADGWATHYRSDLIVGGATDTRADLSLAAGYEVTGYVLDAAGRPLSEAAVTLYSAGGFRMWSLSKEADKTDGDGRFSFQVEPAASEYTVSVTPRTGISLSRRFNVPLQSDLIVQMPGTGVVTGRVVDANTNQPVPGAQVLIGFATSPGQRMGMPEASKAIETDDYGLYRIEGVGTGLVASLTVSAKGYAQFQGNGFMPSDRPTWELLSALRFTGTGETKMPDLPLPRGKTLLGVITNSETGAAVAGARVELSDFVMGNRFTQSAEDGGYRFDGVADRYAMAVTMEGYAPLRDSPFPGQQLASEESIARRDIELEPGALLEGRVRDAAGNPVARALLRLKPADRGWGAWMQAISLRDLWTHTDEEGRYALRGVPSFKLYAEAEAPGYDTGRSDEREVKAGSGGKGLDITLLQGARIEGTVQARDGTPIPNARLTIAKDPGEEANISDEWRALAEGMSTFSDSKGNFLLDGIPVGNVLVRIEAEGYATRTDRRKGIEPAQRLDGVKLEMPPAYVISGTVLDHEGKPFTNAWVRATHTESPDGEPNRQLLGARLEPDGTFQLRNVPPGSFTIDVNPSNWMAGAVRYRNLTQENVPAGAKELVFTLTLAPPPTPGPPGRPGG